MKEWEQVGIELTTPRSAVRQVSAARHVLNKWAMGYVSTLFAYGNMIRYDPTLSLVNLTSNFFVLCTNVKAYL